MPARFRRLSLSLVALFLPLLLLLVALFAAPGVAPAAPAQPESGRQIHLLNGSFTPPAGIAPEAAGQVESALAAGEPVHVLLQLDHLPTAAEKQALRRQGVELLTYVPDYAWIASVSSVEAAQRASGFRWLGAWTAADKLHPDIKAGRWGAWARHPEKEMVMVLMQLHRDVPLDAGPALAAAHGGVALPPIVGLHGMTVWIAPGNLDALAAEEGVLWLEQGPPPLSPTNDGVRASMQVEPLYSAPYNLDGSGVNLFVYDSGTVRATHETFDPGSGSRLTLIDGAAARDHPTHVAGTAAGDGSGSAGNRAQGVAPGATLLSAGYQWSGAGTLFWDNAGDIEVDFANARNNYGADLGTISLGSNTASNGYDCAIHGDYGVSSGLVDGIVRGDNGAVSGSMIMTWANGNERTGGTGSVRGRCGAAYQTTAPPSCAKNPIHVGAVNSDDDSMTTFSSWGPCDDGRLKPVVSAAGCELSRVSGDSYIYSALSSGDSAYGGMCGTSMATPAVAGIATLMIEAWRDQGYGGAGDRPLPALMKALLIHSARDLGQEGPDYIYGYGEVDAQAAVDLIRDGSSLNGSGAVRWGEAAIGQGADATFTVDVPAGAGELKASLAWDDYAAAPFAATALVNDLDLELEDPLGTVYYPWVLGGLASPAAAAGTGVNTVDNQEQVLVEAPLAGTWTVRVRGSSVPQGPQSYGLVYGIAGTVGGSCQQQVSNGGLESGSQGWTLSGASRSAAPAGGHGAFSLQLGGAANSTHTAYYPIAIPGGTNAELSFWWYMDTEEAAPYHTYDFFYVEIWDGGGTRLATVDYRSDGWQEGEWMHARIDLSAWAGQFIRIYFEGTNDGTLATTFWIDDVRLESCDPGPAALIAVAPATFDVPQVPVRQVTYTLALSNSGASDLQWVVGEDTTLAAPSATFVLYSQLDNPGGVVTSQDFETANDVYDAQGADDFIIPTGIARWAIDSVAVPGSHNASDTNPVPLANVFFYADGGGRPGSEVYRVLGAPVSANGGDLTIPLPSPVELAPGHYWLSVQADMAVSPYGQWFWSTRTSQNNSPAHWRNPGDGFSNSCIGWATHADCFGGADPDYRFSLSGTVIAEATCDNPEDLPWVAVTTATGTTSAGTATPLELVFDSSVAAASAPGTYTGTLCIESNAGNEPRVRVPLTMTVCAEPAAVTDVGISANAGDARLQWSGSASYYEIWWQDDFYFTPGLECASAANCTTTPGSPYTHPGGLASSQGYLVLSGEACGPGGVASAPSNRTGTFIFALATGG